eukprot:127586-Amphidinium_carterae.1
MCKHGGHYKFIRARRAAVKKGLLSVLDLVEKNHRVVFERSNGCDNSYAIHKETGEVLKFQLRNRAWSVALEVVPKKEAMEHIESLGTHPSLNTQAVSPLEDPTAVGDIDADDEGMVESAALRAKPKPDTPSREEIEQHRAAGKGRGDRHRAKEDGEVACVGIDYGYLHERVDLTDQEAQDQ